MRKVLFHCGPVTIYSYAAMLYLGIVFGMFAQVYAASLIHLDLKRVIAATLCLLIPALLGACLLFIVAHPRQYKQNPGGIWRMSKQGASMYGGLLLSVPLSVPLLSIMHLPFGAFWDVASFAMLVGAIFARVGCLLNGCCYGRASDGWLAMNLPDHAGVWKRRIPTQVLEAGWTAIVLVGAIVLWGSLPFQGALFLYALGAYSAGRILLESGRQQQDRTLRVGLPRALSIVFLSLCVLVFVLGFINR
jgi:phosphatidylglycerol:prolipoprotein diacylglycerol transferase